MTTLQPRLVRADTMDLQSSAAPSAKDHTRSPTFAPYQHGGAGPHHREALRNAEESAYHDSKSSPHISNGDANHNIDSDLHQYDSTDDDGDDERQDGPDDGAHDDRNDYEEGNDENEDDLEDDLLDKISSSPSIEDGKYSHSVSPQKLNPIRHGAPQALPCVPTRGYSPVTINTFPINPYLDKEFESHWVSHHLSSSVYEGTGKDHTCTVGFETRSKNMVASILPLSRLMLSTLSSDTASMRLDDISQSLSLPDDSFSDEDDPSENTYDDDDDQDWFDEGEPWYEDESSSDDDSDDFQFSNDPRFTDTGWGGECLREVEDIDFEFVYALHTFVATVEGQANATKGDTMVLLDDSNSYWWLVRVVKDGSIGYLPAEHIETPTERLARLNKHRNIDLSASMLGDNPERSNNPLRRAMRRRNAKTVVFTAPTYYEPSEYDYSSDEEAEEEEREVGDVDAAQQNSQQSHVDDSQETQQIVEPQDSVIIVNGIKKVATNEPVLVNSPTSPVHAEAPNSALAQGQPDEAIQRSRNGIVRNTDSFFKDDTVETKKISLTPRLLRNDNEPAANTNEQDLRPKSSSDTFDKMLGSEEKSKEKEKKKEKKGMLSGLFKRKDKGSKNAKNDVDDEKAEDTSRTPQTKESAESLSGPPSPEKKLGKLQKQQPGALLAPKVSPVESKQTSQAPAVTSPMHSPNLSDGATTFSETRNQTQQLEPTGNVRPDPTSNPGPLHSEKRSIFVPITTALKTTASNSGEHEHHVKAVHSKRAKERFAIDGSDSEEEDDETPTMSQTSQEQRAVSPIRNSQLHDFRADSAMAVSPVEPSEDEFNDSVRAPAVHTPNNLGRQHDVHGTPQSDTASTSKPSPSLATHTPSTSRSTPTWSDASLRSYMDSDQDIRDLLIIVHDKSNISPVGPDHPLMGGLFMTERTRLVEMQSQLDSMLTTWMSKKSPGLVAR